MDRKGVVNVPVATIWTNADSPRIIDEQALTSTTNVQDWIDSLDYEKLLELCDANLVQTQALYGEEVLIIGEKDEWANVILLNQPSSKDERGYPGWVPKAQITQAVDWNVQSSPIAVVTSKKAELYSEDIQPLIELSYQTILPVEGVEGDWIKVLTPTGYGMLKNSSVIQYPSFKERCKGTGADIVAAGEQFLDLPYFWGGMSSYGYDCSGFSYNMCKANGYIIPRDATDQAKNGKSIKLAEIEPGDLLFFAYDEGKGKLHHVGIYYGDGKMIHSPKTGKSIEIISLEGTIYEKELCAASRYW